MYIPPFSSKSLHRHHVCTANTEGMAAAQGSLADPQLRAMPLGSLPRRHVCTHMCRIKTCILCTPNTHRPCLSLHTHLASTQRVSEYTHTAPHTSQAPHTSIRTRLGPSCRPGAATHCAVAVLPPCKLSDSLFWQIAQRLVTETLAGANNSALAKTARHICSSSNLNICTTPG